MTAEDREIARTELPPLPRRGDAFPKFEQFTGYDMRDYARTALAAERARADAAERDARRYRWLRDVGDATWRPFGLREGCSAALVDAAIDAATEGVQHGEAK